MNDRDLINYLMSLGYQYPKDSNSKKFDLLLDLGVIISLLVIGIAVALALSNA